MNDDQKNEPEFLQYTCQKVERDIDRYVDNDLDELSVKQMDLHLRHCANCQAKVGELKQLLDTAASLAEQPVPADVSRRLRQRLEEETGCHFPHKRPNLNLV